MFARKGRTFFGVDNVPDDLPDAIRGDSIRHHGNRNGQNHVDSQLARLADKVLVRDADGNTFELPGHAGMKPGWELVGRVSKPITHEHWEIPARYGPGGPGSQPLTARGEARLPISQHHIGESKGWRCLGAECTANPNAVHLDERHVLDDGSTTSHREVLQANIEAHAHELRLAPYRTGRIINGLSEGDGIYAEIADDRPMFGRAIPRGSRVPVENLDKKGSDE